MASSGPSAPRPSKRIAEDLRCKIGGGELRSGDKLPSERALAEQYGAARNTAREAIRLLAVEGLVTAKHGSGVFVREPQPKLTPLHSVSVAGVVVRGDGRLLAIQRADNGEWELPGGVLELEETPEEGVRREVLEETGIHVDVDELTGVYKNITLGVVALVFRCMPSGGTERTSDESTTVEWLTPEEVAERMAEIYAIRLLDALDHAGPHVRSHDGRRLIPAP